MSSHTNDRNGPPRPPSVPSAAEVAALLRQRAEECLLALDSRPSQMLTPEETERLVHELRVHQIELEMQNEELRRAHEALEVSRARYFDLYDLAPVGYLTLGEAGLIQEANLAGATLLMTPRGALIGQSLTRFILPEDQDIHYQALVQLRASGERQSCELRLRHGNGHPIWVRLDTSLAAEATGSHPLWRIILTDITARKEDEQTLIETKERLHRVAEIAELTFWEWDTRTDEVFFPPEWWQQTGYALGELPLRLGELAALLHPEDRERTLADLNRFIATPTAPCEIQYRLRRKDGVYRWFAARLEPILSAQGALERVLLVHQDVTRRKEFEDQAIHLAQHDPLTGLPSRALLDQLAEHMLASTRRSGGQLAVLFFDLDRFKSVNDVYGHAVGDLLLRAVARRLRDAFRAEDLVSRLGGDEFIVVLANIRDSEDAARAARNAIAELTPAYPIEGVELHCVPSIGISLFPRDGETIDGLIQRADTAMYHAKQISPGRYQFVTEALNRQASTMQILETRLREGLARSEFRLAFQPVLDAQSGVVVGVEALLRWPQADGSEIAPQAFLPVAETSGLIHALGQWVFEEVCRQHRVWLDAGLPPIPIAVNVSDRQFQHQEFRPRLAATLEAAGIDPAALSLELSEAALMRDPDNTRRVLAELKQLGVRLALDDFGIGCSSLSGLEELPLDRLELNRVLVRRLRVARCMPAILDAIIGIGRALELEIVAIGVETESDLSFFRDHDCDQVQGFFLGAPMSGSELADWYPQHRAA